MIVAPALLQAILSSLGSSFHVEPSDLRARFEIVGFASKYLYEGRDATPRPGS
jgi:hypothetical protein